MILRKFLLILCLPTLVVCLIAEEINNNNQSSDSYRSYFDLDQSETSSRGGIGQFGFPSNPMNDRAKGYLLKGVVKNAVTNYGNFISWDEHPAGMWKEYTYLPHVGMIAGVPGQKYSYKFNDGESNSGWYKVSDAELVGLLESFSSAPDDWNPNLTLSGTWNDENGGQVAVFCSENAYEAWFQGDKEVFVDVVFDAADDRGNLGERVQVGDDLDHYGITTSNQWAVVEGSSPNVICLSVDYDPYEYLDPNKANANIGFVYPWAKRPALLERLDEFDFYDYGEDQEAWSDDDNYVYYGATVSESWFSRYNPSTNTDWHATDQARQNTHNIEVSAGDLFGDTPFSDASDTYPLLAHSAYSETWPEKFNVETGEFTVEWPGWYAEDYDPEGTNCFPASKTNADCWVQVPGRFISDNDVYMEFDDRWAHRGNTISSSGEYQQTGYPMGLKVKAVAHSYGVSYAEDIMFVTVKVSNESDDMVMPDGTKLNNGLGFDYSDVSFGFYMDADVLSQNLYGDYNVHTNADDFMEYYYDIVEIPSSDGNGETQRMLISMALIGDYDGLSGSDVQGYSMDADDTDPGTDFGIVAVQLLDSPLATENIDFDQDGVVDVYAGEKMKMTDWHWFDWYNRPGVVFQEGDQGGCCAGDPGKAQALNKEEIQYKIMVGDTTNLSNNEKAWFFHADPDLDQLDPNFNPHFDNVEDLKQTSFFTNNEEGLDCVLEMTSGPFNLDVGEETLFSFCIIFGQNKQDLISNAEFAQIMYNNRYQGYTAPKRPTLVSTYDHNQISLHWNDESEYAEDVVTGYSDFEGYKIYKSTDGGVTWGDSEDIIYDDQGVQVGWRPLFQYDLTKQQDEEYCVDLDFVDTDFNGTWDYYDCVEDRQSSDICSYYLDNVGQALNIESKSDCVQAGIGNGTCDAGEPFVDSNENGVWDEGEEFTDLLQCVWVEDSNESAAQQCHQICDPWDYLECTDVSSIGCDDCKRDLNIEGADPHAPWFQMGDNTGFHDITTHVPYVDKDKNFYKYTFVDNDVIDGVVYTYAVTSYDMGVAPSFYQEYYEFESGFAIDTLATQANPSGFSSPNGYQHIENSKGTTILDDNFIKVSSGYRGDYNVDDVYVYPNPYIVSSGTNNETEYQKRIRFTKVPYNEDTGEGAVITVFTITGEKVFSWDVADKRYQEPGEDGWNSWWDLRSVNNQEIAPGLYLYTVEFDGKTSVGKFAVVR